MAIADARRVKGDPPWFPGLAAVMDPAPALLDRFAADFAPAAAKLKSQTAWWLSFHMYAVDRLVGEAMGAAPSAPLRQGLWVIYATCYWAMLDQQQVYGIPQGLVRMGVPQARPSEASVEPMVAKLKVRHAALAAGGEDLFRTLTTLLREEPTTGTLHGAAYDTGYLEVIGEAPPLGERPAHLRAATGAVRVNPRDFLRIDYALPVPDWLKAARTAFELAARQDPAALERIVVGAPGEKNLRAMWGEALAWGHANWGGESLAKWPQDYFDDAFHASIVFNFGLEAVALATFTALIRKDEAAARRAMLGNTLFLASWGPAVMGLMDPAGVLPDVAAG